MSPLFQTEFHRLDGTDTVERVGGRLEFGLCVEDAHVFLDGGSEGEHERNMGDAFGNLTQYRVFENDVGFLFGV